MRNIDFNKYQSALIIGNGFDLSLGLSTSYMDFVNSDEFQILLNMQNQLAIYLKVNAELQNWIDIENELKLYSKNEDNAKFKTEYEALCKQLVVYINNIWKIQCKLPPKTKRFCPPLKHSTMPP